MTRTGDASSSFRIALRSLLAAALLVIVITGWSSSATRHDRPAPASSTPWYRADPFPQAAAALRQRRFDTAREILAAADQSARANLVLGLYAHAMEEVDLAEQLLFEAGGEVASELEDWRLYTLADAAAANRHFPVAQAALSKLLGDYPGSPLRASARFKLAELAWLQGQAEEALASFDVLRHGATEQSGFDEETAERVERLRWEIVAAGRDETKRREVARQLLVERPLLASELGVVESFRHPDGSLEWAEFLGVEALIERAVSLVEVDLLDNARTTLQEVPAAQRNRRWRMVEADCLTRLHRGAEAIELLDGLPPTPDSVELAWAKALAAHDASTTRRGRANLPSKQREVLRERAHGYLNEVANSNDLELARRALVMIYEDLADDDRFDDVMRVLRRLREIAPDDTSGIEPLWRKGWREFTDRNYTGAIGYWTELADLYPEHRFARSGRYWSARAHEKLGDRARAEVLFGEILASDTEDFYSRHARRRIATPSAAIDDRPAVETWPTDPVLSHAEMLSDLGLDDLALREATLVAEVNNRRAYEALTARVLARKGDRRTSIGHVRRAFPRLGGPFQGSVPLDAWRLYYPLDYKEVILAAADKRDLPASLVLAIIRQESAFDARATSWAGARGLMQVMPATGRELARKLGLRYSKSRLHDPSFSVELGTTYFRQVLTMFDGNEELALAGYNSGPYRIKRLWREAGPGTEIDRFLEGLKSETPKNYVKRILVFSDSYSRLYPEAG